MGMYTEIYICSELKEETPIDIFKYLFSDGKEPDILPEHPFFKCDRWRIIGKCSSHYHVPYSTNDLRYDETAKQYFLVSRSDLKNYDYEIEQFFDWAMPFFRKYEGGFIGYSRYKESDEPRLYFKKGS